MVSRASLLICAVGFVCVNAVTIKKCALNDSPCFQQATVSTFKQIVAGIPEIGLESADPLVVKHLTADVAGLKYTFDDLVMNGWSKCDIQNAKYNIDNGEFKMEMYCPLDVSGKYAMKGQLLVLPIEGEGDFTTIFRKMRINVNADVQKTEGKDGKTHLTIKKYTFDIDALDRVIFDFKNLFNGNKELADSVLKFANDNYKDVTNELSGPIFNGALKKLSKHVNKYLKTVSVDDLIL